MASGQAPTLWIETQDGSRHPHEIGLGSHLVGRSSTADVSIASPQVSKRHAEIHWDGRQLSLRDLGSRNGTTVNHSRVADWVGLREGDVISFADVRARVEIGQQSTWSDDPRSDALDLHRPPSDGSPVSVRPSTVPIFISHASEDKRAARAVASHLRRVGWSVWIDEAGIAGGKDWRGELVTALEETWAVVLLVSLSSMRSKWVIREVQAADRLGKWIVPVVIDDSPYPDALRMILGGVQRIDLTRLDDSDYAGQQLTRLDDALIDTARQASRTPPGRTQIAVGRVIGVIGLIGIVVGFALFVALGFISVNEGPGSDEGIPRPFIGWGIFAVSIVVAGIGEGIRRAGLRKGL